MAVTVVTLNTSLVRGTTAKFNGELTDMNGQAAIDCYFQYKITGAGSWSDTSANKEELTAVGEFSYEISGLTENESYDVRAVAEWTDGTLQNAYGTTETFNAFWVREGSQEDFERGILDGVYAGNGELCLGARVFDTPGEHNLTVLTSTFISYIIVAGGGAGGGSLRNNRSGAGGGAGGVLSGTTTLLPGTYEIVVGEGGVGVNGPDYGGDGEDSSAFGLTAIGGGAGGPGASAAARTGKPGGSGGGGQGAAGGAGTSGQGYKGGDSATGAAGGGGGGASEAGKDYNATDGGVGGAGITETLTGENKQLAGGGGGTSNSTVIASTSHGGGSTGSDGYGIDGTPGTGGGGGASSRNPDNITRPGGDGGSGIVIVQMRSHRQKPYKITDTSADIAWTSTTPTDTTLAIEAQVKGTTAITDEAVGTGDGTETVFCLGHWPANTPTVKVNAVAETGFSLGDDRRTITFTTAPADTHAILASYTAVDDPQEDDPEIQTLDLGSPAGGTFKLGDGTTWTSDIAYNATPATIQTALEGLYGAGTVKVIKEILETYTTVGTTSWTVPAGINAVDVLIVAGGGGGGWRGGNDGGAGGGGAGGLIWEENFSVTPAADISVTVGAGGGTNSESSGSDGGDSVFDTLTAEGGGGGGYLSIPGRPGGSGGGAAARRSADAGSGGAGTAGQGNDGGDRVGTWSSPDGGGAGGGGAGSAGSDNVEGDIGLGGDGASYVDCIGTDYGNDGVFAAGGDGGPDSTTTAIQKNGTANTGDGGSGGGSGGSPAAGAGGSGIVIIALPKFVITFDLSVGNSGLTADFTGLT